MKKRFLAVSLVGLLATSSIAGCGGVKYKYSEEKSDISYLYVSTNQGGFGDGFLKALESSFETEYKDAHFAEGKTGVDLVVAQSDNKAPSLFANMPNSHDNVQIVEGLYYTEYAANNFVLDLTDVVTSELKDGSGTIESKLFDDQKVALTATEDKKYYALPVFAGFNGMTYDAELFETEGFYFADEGGGKPRTDSSYTGKAYMGRGFADEGDKKSPGPDGKYNTYDDGLPSTYEEFFYLCDQMVASSITPFIWVGGTSHYANYLFQALLSANSTKTELVSNFTFDSGNTEIDIVKGFTDGQPDIVPTKINSANGYEISQSYNRYLALKFLEHLFSTKDYYPADCNSGISNTDTQEKFVESALDSRLKTIAMLIEGNYWYNEAASKLKASSKQNRNFRYMPLPGVELGTINEGEGSNIALCDSMYYYMIVNNNIKNDAEKVALAKAFVEFFYRESSLQTVNMAVGVPCAVKYELTPEQYASMDNYPQSLWDVYDFSKDNDYYSTALSASPIFLKNTSKFSFKTTCDFFNSRIAELEVSVPYHAFVYNGATARTYFEGMKIDENNWTSKYNK